MVIIIAVSVLRLKRTRKGQRALQARQWRSSCGDSIKTFHSFPGSLPKSSRRLPRWTRKRWRRSFQTCGSSSSCKISRRSTCKRRIRLAELAATGKQCWQARAAGEAQAAVSPVTMVGRAVSHQMGHPFFTILSSSSVCTQSPNIFSKAITSHHLNSHNELIKECGTLGEWKMLFIAEREMLRKNRERQGFK